jgi:hypothetical protein
MTAADSQLLRDIEKSLSNSGYWERFNSEARSELARVAVEAIQRKEKELIRLGVRR